MDYKDTKYASLQENLAAVGKAVFVQFYYSFKDETLSNKSVANEIYLKNPLSKSPNQNYRVMRARHIFQSGQQLEALKLIIESKKLDSKIKKMAETILKQEFDIKNRTIDDIEERIFIQDFNMNMRYDISDEDTISTNSFQPEYINESKKYQTLQYQRNKRVSENALKKANYLCEVDNSHFCF